MHILVGLAALVGVFVLAAQYLEAGFHGYYDRAALIMCVLGPPAVAIMSYDTASLVDAFRTLGQSIFFKGDRDQQALLSDLVRFGRAVREGKVAEASRVLSTPTTHPYLREVGSLAVQRADQSTISETLATVAFARTQRIRRAEDVFQALAAVTPAIGMAGTVVALVQLLANLDDFSKIGSGMAVALLTTLYGLLLCHGFWMPLARHVERYGKRAAVNMKLLERGLLAIASGRPLHDLYLLTGQEEPGTPAPQVEVA